MQILAGLVYSGSEVITENNGWRKVQIMYLNHRGKKSAHQWLLCVCLSPSIPTAKDKSGIEW